MEEETKVKNTEAQCAIQNVMRCALIELGFTECENNRYRRCYTHDFMNVVLDEYGYLWINAELEHKPVEIPITMFKDDELDKFKEWLILTHGA